MNIPRISLVIPAYNEEKYIKACLDSVVENAQGKFFEIIVVDNESTDRTASIAASVPGVRVISEPQRAQKGPTFARERGFRESKGDIVAYIDADTLMPKGWVETIEREFSKNENLVCLSGPYVYFGIPLYQKVLTALYWRFAFLMYFMLGYMVIFGNVAIRRRVLEKMGGLDTKVVFYGDDTNLARRAHEYGKVKFTFAFKMYTSGRRLVGQGFLNTAFIYVKSFFSEVFKLSPAEEEYTEIR